MLVKQSCAFSSPGWFWIAIVDKEVCWYKSFLSLRMTGNRKQQLGGCKRLLSGLFLPALK